ADAPPLSQDRAMADSYKFYIERAEAAAVAAGAATLENVRERELRAEKTWLGLAHQAKAVAAQREKSERERADRRSAELES
ncbi:MAG: hypothetical protein ACO25F_05295, partial [Erythrobacter sp.]